MPTDYAEDATLLPGDVVIQARNVFYDPIPFPAMYKDILSLYSVGKV